MRRLSVCGSLRTDKDEGIKRERGEVYPSGTESAAAPATVSGEAYAQMPLESREGCVRSVTREPGDLPL